MRTAFDKIDDFLKTNPFNLKQSDKPDSDELFHVDEKDEPSSHLDEIKKAPNGLSDEDVERIARKLVEIQNTAGGDVHE